MAVFIGIIGSQGMTGKVGKPESFGKCGKDEDIFFGKALNPRNKDYFCSVLRSWFFVLRS